MFKCLSSSHVELVPVPASGVGGARTEVPVDGAVVGEGLHALPADVRAALGTLHVMTAAVFLNRRAAVAIWAHFAIRRILPHPFLNNEIYENIYGAILKGRPHLFTYL